MNRELNLLSKSNLIQDAFFAERMRIKRAELIWHDASLHVKTQAWQFRLQSKPVIQEFKPQYFKSPNFNLTRPSFSSWKARFNDLIMVAMLSNLAHTFEVGGQSASWMQERPRGMRQRYVTVSNKCHYTIFHDHTGWLRILLVNTSRDPMGFP